MSLFYKCDCCGKSMHRVGDNGGKRLHLDVGDLMDDALDSTNKRTSWNIEEWPLISVDLCSACYNDIIVKIKAMRKENYVSDGDLGEVIIGGKSVSM